MEGVREGALARIKETKTMTEAHERSTTERRELPDTTMVDRSYKLPEGGIEYQAVIGLNVDLANLTELYADELGLVSAVAQVDIPSERLRVVAHVDEAYPTDEEGKLVDLIDSLASDHGIDIGQEAGLPEAS